ncbi:MAG: hypothetical protein IJV00_07455 [Clostridia bacterium]|nr:hypothetical protein [Clostridia bacterium]
MSSFFGLKKLFPALIGIALFLVIGVLMASGADKDTSDAERFRDAEQKRLKDLIVSLDGVESAEVMLSVEESFSGSGSVSVFASSEKNKTPKIVGAAVICRGRGTEKLRLEIIRLIGGLYGIGSNKISVIF